jgi:hypothetical protein
VYGEHRDEFIVSKTPTAFGRALTFIPSGIHFFTTCDEILSLGSHSSAAFIEYSSVNFLRRLGVNQEYLEEVTRRIRRWDTNSRR